MSEENKYYERMRKKILQDQNTAIIKEIERMMTVNGRLLSEVADEWEKEMEHE
jgi:hypothetical protein